MKARITRDAKRAEMQWRWRRGGRRDLFIDYGWIKLLYTGDADDQEVAYHLNQHVWHEKDQHVFRSLLAPGQTAVDVGANLGFVTTMLASLVGPNGRVVAFEPSPKTFHKLTKTLEINELRNVTALNKGCGASRATLQLHEVSPSSGNASILGSGPATDIQVERLDDVPEVREARVALLKIDTEGYEPEVLIGAQGMIAEYRPIIYLEMGGEYVASTLRSIELLNEAGYDTGHVESLDWDDVGNGSNYFFLPRRSPGP